MAPLLHRAAIKITHALVFGGPLRLGALGPGPPGPLVKTALAHTYEQTNSSLDWVLSHWAHFTVLRFIFACIMCIIMVALCNTADHIYFHAVSFFVFFFYFLA